MSKVTLLEQKLSTTMFPKIQITYDRIADRLTQVFTPAELKEYFLLYEESQVNPKNALPKILDFQKKHPYLPEVYNLLSYTFIRRKKIKKAEKLIQENYEKNPDYLFARINYADQCLRKKKSSKIPEIFNNKTNLSEIYPERKCYHFSELIGYVCVMGFYYLSIGEREKAMDYCAYARLIDSNDETLSLLERKLFKRGLIQNIIKALSPKKSH